MPIELVFLRTIEVVKFLIGRICNTPLLFSKSIS